MHRLIRQNSPQLHETNKAEQSKNEGYVPDRSRVFPNCVPKRSAPPGADRHVAGPSCLVAAYGPGHSRRRQPDPDSQGSAITSRILGPEGRPAPGPTGSRSAPHHDVATDTRQREEDQRGRPGDDGHDDRTGESADHQELRDGDSRVIIHVASTLGAHCSAVMTQGNSQTRPGATITVFSALVGVENRRTRSAPVSVR